ncbi:MAG: hypothetical protein E7588_00635 [Ruminococcaceae bacterium]|nr:hypothetical protein [Oscillospiraceae bacterium]
MIKGCTKRVIVIKNPEGNYFDEAYFIVKERFNEQKQSASSETKMIDEANRIISDNILNKYCTQTQQVRRKASLKFSPIAVYIMGMATSCLIITLCRLVLF